MSNPLASFLALESDERRIVLQAMVMLPAMVLRLRRHGYKAALAQVEQTRMGSAGRSDFVCRKERAIISQNIGMNLSFFLHQGK